MKELTLKQAAEDCRGTLTPEQAEGMITGVQIDSRRVKPGDLFVAIKGEKSDGHDFIGMAASLGASAALVQRPVKAAIPTILVPDTIKAYGDLAAARRERMGMTVIGITGSVGKTTTKEMIAAVLETTYRTEKTAANFNNGLGLPVTVLGLQPDCEAAVLEMGMNHFGELSVLTRIAQPDIAVITNIGTMHIENLGSREGILRAKLELLEGLRPGGTVFFNGDDDLLRTVRETYHAKCFGVSPDCDVRAEDIRMSEDGIRFTAAAGELRFPVELPVVGRHNVLNALAAIAVGLELHVPVAGIQAGLAGFHNTGMRQKIYPLRGMTVIEDCYNAGPESMRAALQVLKDTKTAGRHIAVLGGMLELGDHAPLAHYEVGKAAAQCADLLFAYGAHAEEYVRGAEEAGIPAQLYPTHEALTEALCRTAKPGDVLLVKGSRGMRMERVLELLGND